jgi:hypothetical protein
MSTLETEIKIGADGSLELLSPLPAWLKPDRAHVLMTVALDARDRRNVGAWAILSRSSGLRAASGPRHHEDEEKICAYKITFTSRRPTSGAAARK